MKGELLLRGKLKVNHWLIYDTKYHKVQSCYTYEIGIYLNKKQ